MAGRGRGFLRKPEVVPLKHDETSEKESIASSSVSSFPIIGRGGRGLVLRPQSSRPTPSADSLSDVESSVSSFPLFGRGRGIAFAARKTPSLTDTKKSSESDPIEFAKNFPKDQFADLPCPTKDISDSSGRGRSSGRESDGKDSIKSISSGMQKLRMGLRTLAQPTLKSQEFVAKTSKDNVEIEAETEPEEETETVVKKHGSKGTPYRGMTNCIMISCDKDFGVFEYEVRFKPEVDYTNHRYKYLGQLRDQIGNVRIFDGVTLYLPKMLDDKNSTFITPSLDENEEISVNIIFRRKKRLGECVHLYNVLFERIMNDLNYQRVGRKCFDPSAPKVIKQHKLEVWPGYVKSVEEQEGGLMLLLDVSHRVLSQKTVLEYFHECREKSRQCFKDMIKKAMIGHIVLTRYNNKTYRVDDVDFENTPKSTFKKGDVDIPYYEYYKKQYGLIIQDLEQPILIHREDVRLPGHKEKVERTFCLIPELCYVTGLTDEMRSQFTVMKDLAVHTKLTPHQRVTAYQKYIENINNNEKAKQRLLDWGLKLDSKPCEITARLLNKEVIIFGQNKSFDISPQADFSRNATSSQVLDPTNLQNWILIYVKNDKNAADSFEKISLQVCGPIGMRIAPPRRIELPNDRTETFLNAIKDNLKGKNIQMVVTIFPTLRDDRYAAVKKTLCSDLPCPSQCINSRTLRNEAKNRSIVQKIVLQINCKLGGSLWGIKIPLKNTMIVGIDTYHEANQQGITVGGLVASLNSSFTKWNSVPTIQKKKEELINGLLSSMERALNCYKRINDTLPDRIIIYRDGVGDGQLNHVQNYEVPQFVEVCSKFAKDYSPNITFIVVQKRINHKFFKINHDRGDVDALANPPPGTVVDSVVTRRNMYDFFLCSQHVREGTLTPSHYIVLRDDTQFEPDIVQQLTYKLSFLYYNWPGAVRVPAPCQYAHKLAYLVGLAVKSKVDESLTDKLFFL